MNLLRRFEIRPVNAADAKAVDAMPSEEPVDVRAMLETRDPLVNPIAGIHSGPTLSPEGGVHVLLVARTPVEHDDVVPVTVASNMRCTEPDHIGEPPERSEHNDSAIEDLSVRFECRIDREISTFHTL